MISQMLPPSVVFAVTDLEWIIDFLKIIKQEGTFAVGVVLGSLIGCVVSYFANKSAALERTARLSVDIEREKQLLAQLELKDKRIDALHQQLVPTSNGGAAAIKTVAQPKT